MGQVASEAVEIAENRHPVSDLPSGLRSATNAALLSRATVESAAFVWRLMEVLDDRQGQSSQVLNDTLIRMAEVKCLQRFREALDPMMNPHRYLDAGAKD